MAAGSISEDEFWDSVIYFLKLSDKLDRKWTVREAKDGGKYVMKKEEELRCKDKDLTPGADFYRDQEVEEEDSSALQTDGESEQRVLTCEYHIVYSQSYNVPVLYFNAHFQNGKLLSLEEIWEMVPAVYKERLSQDRWTFISQQEHPLLGRPFYFLHPCHTADLMKNIPTLSDKSGIGGDLHKRWVHQRVTDEQTDILIAIYPPAFQAGV